MSAEYDAVIAEFENWLKQHNVDYPDIKRDENNKPYIEQWNGKEKERVYIPDNFAETL